MSVMSNLTTHFENQNGPTSLSLSEQKIEPKNGMMALTFDLGNSKFLKKKKMADGQNRTKQFRNK